MKTSRWLQFLYASVVTVLVSVPGLGMAADNDQDGIDDTLEATGGISFGGFTYPPCTGTPAQGAARNACVSPGSKDIFVYLVTPAGGGFLHQNGLINANTNPADVSVLFQFITAPNTANGTGKVNGLGVGVHVAVVNTAPASRALGALGQQAVVMTVDESASAFAFGATDQGTPTNTGNTRIWPVYTKNFINNNIFGRVDTPSVWKVYIQRTASHELSHAAALTATYNSSLGQYHYATGSGVVMDDSVVCNSKRKTCTIYTLYASGDKPCLLGLISPRTNPLQCAPLPVPGGGGPG